MMMLFHLYLLLIFILGTRADPCLVNPRITSILRFNYNISTTTLIEGKSLPSLVDIYVEFLVDYQKLYSFQQFRLNLDDGGPEGMSILKEMDDLPQPIYSGMALSNPTLLQSKSVYTDSTKKFTTTDILDHRGACSEILMYQADYHFEVQPGELLQIMYRQSDRCIFHRTNYTNRRVDIMPRFDRRRDIVAAYYLQPLLLEITSDSKLLITRYDNSNHPTNTAPLGRGFILSPNIFRFYHDPPAHGDQSCKNLVKKWSPLSPPHKSIFLRTLTRLHNVSYAIVNSGTEAKCEMMKRQHNQLHTGDCTLPDPHKVLMDLMRSSTVEVWSFTPTDGESYDADIILVEKSSGDSLYYKRLGAEHKVERIRFGVKPIPDDITHWTTCKKIVSIYGLFYTLHGFDDHVLTNKSMLQRLDSRIFDYPIDSMHSDGDYFYFVVKRNRVLKMEADSSDCTKLGLTYVEEMQFDHFMNPRSSGGGSGGGGDGEGGSNSSPPVWPYIAIGLVITAAILVLIFVSVLRSSKKTTAVFYSKSRDSNTHSVENLRDSKESQSGTPQTKQTSQIITPSNMPLFSQVHKSIQSGTGKAKSPVKSPAKKLKQKLKSKNKSKTKSKSPSPIHSKGSN